MRNWILGLVAVFGTTGAGCASTQTTPAPAPAAHGERAEKDERHGQTKVVSAHCHCGSDCGCGVCGCKPIRALTAHEEWLVAYMETIVAEGRIPPAVRKPDSEEQQTIDQTMLRMYRRGYFDDMTVNTLMIESIERAAGIPWVMIPPKVSAHCHCGSDCGCGVCKCK